MTLAPATRLGPYEIVAPLGAGGMGEVYRARDTRLGREVAVKVLPRHLSSEPEVRARFEREAKTVSGLNHPHICTLHDVGREGDTDYLVMELIEGETLAAKLARGPLAPAEVLRLGGQVADALDRAHRAGVVHRDLKPGNIMLTKSGAKLMDFGLARATGLAGAAGSGSLAGTMTHSPTVAEPLTAEGSIVGTFQYMAPEQLEGKEADARADLWALGCVLYEMATGKRAFDGSTQASLISAIMRDTPRPMAELSPLSPPGLERLVGALLAKDPADRVQSAHDVKLQLGWAGESAVSGVASGAGGAAVAPASRGRGSLLAWGISALAATLALAAWLLPSARGPRNGIGPVSSTIAPPEGITLSPLAAVPLAISPDGSHIVFCARVGNGPDQLWVRALASAEVRPLAGTESATFPFFSPDGRSIAFFSNDKLRRVPTEGGPVTVIADAPDPRGGSWGRRDVIVFAPRGAAGLSRVKAEGGPVTSVTELDDTLGEATHRNPHFLPDGVHFLYLARRAGAGKGEEPTVYAASIERPGRTRVLGVASNVAYASGHLLYVSDGNLVAQAFDPRRRAVSGPALPISDRVRMDERFSRGTFAVSQNGVLVFMTGASRTRSQLLWVDRDGAVLGPVGEPGDFTFGGQPRIDPSGRRAAVAMLRTEVGVSDVWIVDLESGRRRRLAVDDEDHYSHAWTSDGQRIVMNTLLRSGGSNVISRAVDGTGVGRTVVEERGYIYTDAVSPDDRWLLATVADSASSFDVVAIPLEGEGRRLPVGVGHGEQMNSQFSPDGRFVAYTSDETGRDEVYVTPFPGFGAKWQASPAGGRQPRWSRDGRELFYIDPGNHLTVVDVVPSGALVEFGAPRKLFQIYGSFDTVVRYDIAPDGRRFLVSLDAAEDSAAPITLVTDWVATLKR